MFQMVAFDLDGTIADTIPMCIKAFRNSVAPYTDHVLCEEEILRTFGLNEIGMVKAVVKENQESAIEDFYFQYESLHQEVTDTFLEIEACYVSPDYRERRKKLYHNFREAGADNTV